MKIEVTAQDIIDGCPRETSACPIALAATRAGLFDVTVLPDRIMHYLRGEICSRVITLPQEARDFIAKFDKNQDVEPLSFEVQ